MRERDERLPRATLAVHLRLLSEGADRVAVVRAELAAAQEALQRLCWAGNGERSGACLAGLLLKARTRDVHGMVHGRELVSSVRIGSRIDATGPGHGSIRREVTGMWFDPPPRGGGGGIHLRGGVTN